MRAGPLVAEALHERVGVDLRHGVVVDVPGDRHDRALVASGEPCHAADHLAVEALRVDEALAGDHEVGRADAVRQVELVGQQVEAGEQLATEGQQPTGEAARRAGAGDAADVDAVLLLVDLGETLEPPGEQLHLRRGRTFLTGEHPRCVDERRAHVARDEQLDAAQAIGDTDGPHRTEAPVGGGRAAEPDDDPPRPGVERGVDQLAGTGRARRHRVVAAGSADEIEPGSASHLHDRRVALQPPLRLDRIAERAGHHRPAVRAAERLEPPLAAVGHGGAIAAVSQPGGGAVDRVGDLARRGGTTELVDRCQHSHGHDANGRRGALYRAAMDTTEAQNAATAELAFLDATAQAELVRTGQASPAELVEAAITRIEQVNPQLNAVIGDRFERARQEASESEVPLPEGPFRGVPFLVKDLTLMMEGEPYHGGTRFLKRLRYVAGHDTYLARRFRAAGFVTLGRTNTPEWGSTITTEPIAYGACHNPWNLAHSTGGSSGGSAAAVAAGLVPVAHANDGGGSIRIPASECGLFGLKPSRGRVSHGPDAGEGWMGATVDGCVSRSVRDTAAVLDAISGAMPGDPYTAPPPTRPFLAEVGADPGRLKIGVLAHPLSADVASHAECEAAVRVAVDLLHGVGHHVEEAFPAALVDETFSYRFSSIVAVATAADVAMWEAELGVTLGEDDLEADNLALAALGRQVAGPDYLAAVNWMHEWSRRVVRWWEPEDGSGGFDLLLTPTLAGPPPPLGYLSGPEGTSRMFGLLQYTAQFNITGQPACSVPLHWTTDGLPVGVQLVGAPWREDVLLRVAAQLEAAQPWADRRPPVHA